MAVIRRAGAFAGGLLWAPAHRISRPRLPGALTSRPRGKESSAAVNLIYSRPGRDARNVDGGL
jgi:hypothetical protein